MNRSTVSKTELNAAQCADAVSYWIEQGCPQPNHSGLEAVRFYHDGNSGNTATYTFETEKREDVGE